MDGGQYVDELGKYEACQSTPEYKPLWLEWLCQVKYPQVYLTSGCRHPFRVGQGWRMSTLVDGPGFVCAMTISSEI
jgi:hypothetical protein